MLLFLVWFMPKHAKCALYEPIRSCKMFRSLNNVPLVWQYNKNYQCSINKYFESNLKITKRFKVLKLNSPTRLSNSWKYENVNVVYHYKNRRTYWSLHLCEFYSIYPIYFRGSAKSIPLIRSSRSLEDRKAFVTGWGRCDRTVGTYLLQLLLII